MVGPSQQDFARLHEPQKVRCPHERGSTTMAAAAAAALAEAAGQGQGSDALGVGEVELAATAVESLIQVRAVW